MKVFLHIGYYKTGTTALQKFLEDNRIILHQVGVCYPTAGKPVNNWGLGVLANGLLESVGARVPAWYRRGKNRRPELYDAPAQWAAAVNELGGSGCGIGIISCEAFIRFGDAPQSRWLIEFVQQKLAHFDVKIICYVRRPDRYLISWYKQLVAAGDRIPRLSVNLDHYVETIHVDYMRALRPWAAVFGRERMLIRDYDAMRDTGMDTIEDFIRLCGLTLPADVTVSGSPMNRSIPNALVELKRLHNHLANGVSDLRKGNRALQFVQDHIALPADELVEMLSGAERERLISAFLPCLEALTRLWGGERAFFPDLEQPVFPGKPVMTDIEAALEYAGIFSLALSQISPCVADQ